MLNNRAGILYFDMRDDAFEPDVTIAAALHLKIRVAMSRLSGCFNEVERD